MSLNDARVFVAKMKEDPDFRKKVTDTAGPEELLSFLDTEGLRFDQRELAGAMAECMAQMERQTGP